MLLYFHDTYLLQFYANLITKSAFAIISKFQSKISRLFCMPILPAASDILLLKTKMHKHTLLLILCNINKLSDVH